jgi:hypothetical protein
MTQTQRGPAPLGDRPSGLVHASERPENSPPPLTQQDVIVGSCAYIIGMHRAHDLPPAGMMRMVLAAVPGSTASHYEAALLKLSRARHWWEL